MATEDSYKGIAAASEGLYKDKGSRFIAYAYPVTSEGEVKPLVDVLKAEHHAARHHCFAYRIGAGGGISRSSDDGEPSGTAGRPILGAIDSAGLSDVLVVVVRYFGGILLGVPGLIQAYREAAADALAKAVVVGKLAVRPVVLEFSYEEMNVVQKVLKTTRDIGIVSQDFDNQCRMQVNVRLSEADNLMERINRINNERDTCIQCRPL